MSDTLIRIGAGKRRRADARKAAMPPAEITRPGDLLIGENPMRHDDVAAATRALPASEGKWEWA